MDLLNRMNKQFQIYAVTLLLVIVILALYFSEGFSIEGVYSFEDCVDAGNFVMESYPRQCMHEGVTYVEDIGSELEIYFRNELYEQGVENVGGMPIEGFNPGIYKNAFPGFRDSDFHNAEAVGGKWIFDKELKWIEENPGGPITSADGTITNEGLDVVLENLEERFGMDAALKNDVDQIISMLSIHKCGFDERLAEACISLYDPVCGWNDPDKIQCIKYPCASAYSNGCEACKNEGVAYWTPGECPA